MGRKHIIAVNTASQIAGKIITGGSTFAFSVLLAREIGTAGYGDFTKITTYVALFYLAADFGLNAVYLQHSQIHTPHTDENSSDLKALATLRLLLSLSLIFLSTAILVFLPYQSASGYPPYIKLSIIMFIPTILLQAGINTANAVFQKHFSYSYSTLSLSVGSLITLIGIYVASAVLKPGIMLSAGLLITLGGTAVTSLFSLWLARRLEPRFSLGWNPEKMAGLLRSSLPLALTLAFNTIYFRADSIILGLTRSPSDVGIYGFAYKLFEFPLVIPTFFMNAVYPLLVQALRDGKDSEYKTLIRKSSLTLGVLSLLITGFGWIASGYLSLVRPEFSAGTLPLRILLLGLPVFFISSITMWMLVATRRRLALILIYGSAMIMNILSNCIFVPRYGYNAAAVITGISELYILLASLAILRKSSVRS